jgi:site-specific DNA-cytosine methylase
MPDKGKIYVLDIFSGTGELGRAFGEGISELLGIGVRTAAYCEIERYPQAVLLSRMSRGEIDVAPICTDIRELRAADFFGEDGRNPIACIDAIVGGWPCQGNSIAGLRKGMADERSGLVTEVIRLVEEFRPSIIFLENVPGVLTAPGDGVEFVCSRLAALGYDYRYTLLSAAEVGASHGRNRFWLMAHTQGAGAKREAGKVSKTDGGQESGLPRERDGASEGVGDSNQTGCRGFDNNSETSRGLQQESSQRCTTMADSNGKRESQSEGGLADIGGRIGDGIETMANAASQRQPKSGSRGKRKPSPKDGIGIHHRPEFNGGELGDSSEGRRGIIGSIRESGYLEQPVQEMGNSESEGFPIRREGRLRDGKEYHGFELPSRPPAPGDIEAWQRILRAYPEVEPALRGMATRFPCRADRIRALGNSVDFPTAKAAVKVLLGLTDG